MGIIRIIVVLAILTLLCIVAPKFVGGVIDDNAEITGFEEKQVTPVVDENFDMTLGEWKQALSPELYKVARCGGTEAPFSGKYNQLFDMGEYYCFVCANILFRSEQKIESKSGWPTFSSPALKDCVVEYDHESDGVVRRGLKCSTCDSHLGFISYDYPEEKSGEKYSINSISLRFIPAKNEP